MPARLLPLALLLSLTSPAFAQQRCWVFFTDRAGAAPGTVSKETRTARRQVGLPEAQATDAFPPAAYTQAVEALAGQPVRVRSRWLNGVSVVADAALRQRLAALPFVAEVRPVASSATARLKGGSADTAYPTRFSKGLSQVGGGWLAKEKLTGKGVTIGLIDAGFGDADKTDDLKHLFAAGQIKAARDFEQPGHTESFFRVTSSEIDDHGTSVLGLIAGQEAGARYGGAVNATFVLARTDNASKEYRHEEDIWLNAMEWMDSLGVRLINTSLGYALGFDDKAQNHKREDIDGKSSPVTRAVNAAVEQKGIVVVVSAGNDGGNPAWGLINMPADAPGALAIGATLDEAWVKVGYSGIGPETLSYVKPDVSAYSILGTSFSAPIVTGLMGCLMERHPGLKAAQYADALRESGHLQGVPNNFLGYGVPDARRAHLALAGTPAPVPVQRLRAKGATTQVQTGPGGPATAVYFHKKNARIVMRQGTLPSTGGTFLLNREPGAAFTTLATPTQVWEVEWGK